MAGFGRLAAKVLLAMLLLVEAAPAQPAERRIVPTPDADYFGHDYDILRDVEVLPIERVDAPVNLSLTARGKNRVNGGAGGAIGRPNEDWLGCSRVHDGLIRGGNFVGDRGGALL